jgi:carboxyl-terminal processing protease
MIDRLAARFLLLAFCGGLVGHGFCAATETVQPAATQSGATTNGFHPVVPGPVDGRIAFLTARMLEEFHYSKQPFDEAVSSRFFDRYFEAYDPQHLHFLQSDLAEFERYRNQLGHLTIRSSGTGDTRPATEIFNRFFERLQQRVNYVEQLLDTEQFTFETDERIAINRKELPYPKDLEEAHRLWRRQLRFEYLQEKLGRIETKKKAAAAKGKEDAPAKPKSDAEEIVDTLKHRYHRNLRLFRDWTSDDVLQVYLTALAHVYDPHSDYLGKSQLDSFAIGMNLSLFGIGAELTSEDGYCTIRRLLPGGPALKSKKIKEKDRIVAVAQGSGSPVDVVEMSLNKAVQLIRGPKGTEVRLTIIPAGEDSSTRRIVSLIRDEIPLEDQAAKAKLIELPQAPAPPLRIGVIDLPSFYASFDPANNRGKSEPKSTTADVVKLLTKLKQERVGGIILDLRRNGGGSLEEAIRLTGLFIKDGPVVQVRNSRDAVDHDDDADPSVFYDGPLVVLTSRFSASASEILAGALQDYGRALIVGEASTHGKGTVQMVNALKPYMQTSGDLLTNDPGALKVTIKKFYRASGASTQLRGVEPDIVLPSIWNESKDVGEKALDNPMPWDTIASAKFDRLNLVAPGLAELRKRSAARVAADPEFAYVREDIQLYKKQQADKTVSLNEQQRLKEKAEAEARTKARNKERLARKDPAEKVYEITLKQAVLPGLPPPVEKTNSTLAKLSGQKPVLAGAASNSVAASLPGAAPGAVGTEEDAEEEKPPLYDAMLIESQRILVDYIPLFPQQGIVAARGQAEAAPSN